MTDRPLRIALIGVDPGRSWAANVHIPALRAQPRNFEIVGLANSNAGSGRKAAAAMGLPQAFNSVDDMLASPSVEVVAITVKVPEHRALVLKALDAGKHVYCEWPLGVGLNEAKMLAAHAADSGLHAVVGTQARLSPAIRHAADLIANGYVGEVLSATVIGGGGPAGPTVAMANTYTLDVRSGANLLTIPFGHAMAAIAEALGGVATVSAELATRCCTARVVETGEKIPRSAPDQVVVAGVLNSGAPLSVHYRGTSMDTGFLWEVTGSRGALRVTAGSGHVQMADATLQGFTGRDRALARINTPDHFIPIPGLDQPVAGVAYVYHRFAADLRDGVRAAPSFNDAVATHRLIAAVEMAARTGCRVALEDIE